MADTFANIELVRDEFRYLNRSFIFDRVKNLDDLVNLVSDDEFNVDERLPYWAELWPSAIGLCRFLIKNAALFKGKNVLELGCGLGLTSMVIASLNPAEFVLTDYEQDALFMARHNFVLNNIDCPVTRILDWRHPELEGQFNCIVASDIVYERRFFPPLLQLFRNYLRPDGFIILAEPNRAIAGSFFQILKEHGYYYQVENEYVIQDQSRICVSVYKIRKGL
ncbi:MAG: methyltransferase domain-containing protein [Calditrichaceae bacterium]|nr:methyltransferase domain-containing protein [Calditrichaceae bacterium]MBN2707431.1 methyltransferase domain-containing protein [Calditrichaceae bacterium]RQV93999.1 MAG: methyltransferase domain-containing protein [Calditrichota bacterium]